MLFGFPLCHSFFFGVPQLWWLPPSIQGAPDGSISLPLVWIGCWGPPSAAVQHPTLPGRPLMCLPTYWCIHAFSAKAHFQADPSLKHPCVLSAETYCCDDLRNSIQRVTWSSDDGINKEQFQSAHPRGSSMRSIFVKWDQCSTELKDNERSRALLGSQGLPSWLGKWISFFSSCPNRSEGMCEVGEL